ncbi:MAG TPA: AmmeMemoRadiSam system protein A [Candidatus Sulfomarinibacteraceae bacterium]|nr:AmmeMemoRadiSam system protein A [Candidatus Sulfomarinibacteraceae bacterium]
MIAIDEQAATLLLKLARSSLTAYVQRQELHRVSWRSLPPSLQQKGSCFVTLMNCGRLRGCIGSTKGELPLAYDVTHNAVAAARDPRFEPVLPSELVDIRLEVTVLQPPIPLVYENEADLYHKLRPGQHGVIIAWRGRQALLLPQVWQRVAEPGEFLEILCQKADIPWHVLHDVPPSVEVLIFEATRFEEDGYYFRS